MTDKTDTAKLAPRYLMRGIPNNADGRSFIKELRSYLNRDRWRVTLRGNGPSKNGKVYPYGVPTGQAASLRLYVDDIGASQYAATECQIRAAYEELATVRAAVHHETDKLDTMPGSPVARAIVYTVTATDIGCRVNTTQWQYAYGSLAAAERAIESCAAERALYSVPELAGHEPDGSYMLVYTSDDRDGHGDAELTRFYIRELTLR